MPPSLVLEIFHTAGVAAVFVIGLLIRNQSSKDREEIKQWTMDHFVSKDTCDQHRNRR